MTPHGLTRLLFAPAAILAMFLSACLNEQAAMNTPADLELTGQSADPRIDFLVKETNVKRELISVAYDPVSKDTGYILEPALTTEEKKRGVRATGIGFKATEVDRMIQLSKERQALAVEPQPAKLENGMLVKTAQTRWDSWYAYGDVKRLDQVRQVRVFIYKSGPMAVGSNWVSAIRSAISNWNAQAKGTAISFVETSSESDYSISFRGTYGIGSDGNMSSSAFIVGTEFMTPDITLWVNTAFESNGLMPSNQKTTVAMNLLGLSTNVTFTGKEGYYWNNGTSVHVPGTPYSDGDASSPGSSIMNQGTSAASTPVMTAADLKTFRSMYPVFGTLAISTSSRSLKVPGAHGVTIDNDVKAYSFSTDTVVYMRNDGKVYRRIGLNGTNVQMWPGTGSSGTAETFLYDQGYWAVRTNQGRVYTRTPTGNWILQSGTHWIDPQDYRLDGNRLVLSPTGRQYLYSYYLGSTSPSSPVIEYYNAGGNILDWDVRNGLLVVSDLGDLWGKQGTGSWVFLHSAAANGHVENVTVSSQHKIAIFYIPPAFGYYSVAVRHGLYGYWNYYSSPVYTRGDIQVCGDKLAFLQQNTYLFILDYSTGTVHHHYSMPTGSDLRSVRLSGPNCDYVTAIHHANLVYAKYGVDVENRYLNHSNLAVDLWQGAVPTE